MKREIRDIKRIAMLQEALKTRSHNVFLEFLIALLVFFIGSMIASVLQTPAMMGYLLTNQDYIHMIQTGQIQPEKLMAVATNLPDWIMIISLLSEAVLIAVFILYCRFFEKRKAATMGFKKKGFLLEYGRGILLGVVAFGAAYLLCVLSGSVQFQSTASKDFTVLYLIGFFFAYLVQGMAEEVVCRGYLMVSLTRRYPVTMSVVLSSIFFSMLHGMNRGMSLISYINLFLFGVLMALMFIRYENIWVVGAFHGIWNFVQGNLFGVQVSGMKHQRSLFTSVFSEKGEVIHGGAFGLEGGLAVTLMLVFAIAILLWRMKVKGYLVETKPAINPYDILWTASENPYCKPDDYVEELFGEKGINPYWEQRRAIREKRQRNAGITEAQKNQQELQLKHMLSELAETKDSEDMGAEENQMMQNVSQQIPSQETEKHQDSADTKFNQSYFKDS